MKTQTFVRKLQKISTHSYVINVPKAFIDHFQWKEHQRLVLSLGERKRGIRVADFTPRRKSKKE